MSLHEWRYRLAWILVLAATGIAIYLQFGWVVDTLSWSISKFDNKHLAFGIAIVILLVAVGIWVFLHFWRHRPWVEPIRRLTRALQEIDGDTQHDPKDRIAKANEVFDLAEPQIKRLWQKYREHLQPDPQGPGYLNLMDPRLWFSVESLPGRGYEQWCATWAGVFLTIGLLFTFIGLSAALLKVGGIADADSMAMKQAITDILGVSSAKFITSIAGLLAYIGFSLVTRRYQSSQQAAARELADAVQHLSVPLTPELLLYEQNKTALKQLERMDRFTDDLAVAIDGKLEKRLQLLSSEFGEHLGTIQQNLPGATAEPIVDAIQNMTQAVATEFSTQVQQTAGGEINSVAVRLAEVAEKLTSVKNDMGGVGEAFGKDIQTAAASLVDAAKQMSQGVNGQSSELEGKISQFSSKLDNIAATLGQVPGSIDSALNETLKKLTESIGDISTSVGQVPARIDAALNDTLTKLTNAIDALVQQIGEGGKSGATALSVGGEEAGNRLKNSAGEAGQQLKDKLGEVSGKLDAIAGSLSQIPDSINLTLNNTLTKLTESVDMLLSRLTQGGEEGANALINGGQEAGNTLKASADLAGKELTTQMGQFSQKLDNISDILARIPSNIDSALNGTLAKLREVPNSIDGALDKTLEKRSKTVGELVEKLNQGGKSGATALRDGGEKAGALLKESAIQAGQELKGKLGEVAGSLDQISKTLGQMPNSINFALNESLKGLAQGGEKAGEGIKLASGTLETAIENFAARLQTVESSLKSLPEAVAAQVKNLTEAGRTFEGAGQMVVNSGTALRQASEPLQQTANAIQASLIQVRQGIAEANAIHQQTNESVQTALVQLKNAADAAQRTFKTHEERFGAADADLANALSALRIGVEQVVTGTNKAFSNYANHIEHAVGVLSNWGEGLEFSVKELADSIRQAPPRR